MLYLTCFQTRIIKSKINPSLVYNKANDVDKYHIFIVVSLLYRCVRIFFFNGASRINPAIQLSNNIYISSNKLFTT